MIIIYLCGDNPVSLSAAKVRSSGLTDKRLQERALVTPELLLLRINRRRMEKIIEKYSNVAACPVRNVISHFSSKWGILILLVLNEGGQVRFNELTRILPDISPKMLSSTLKTLAADGLVCRHLYAEVPPRTEYTITEKGKSLVPILEELVRWASCHMPGH